MSIVHTTKQKLAQKKLNKHQVEIADKVEEMAELSIQIEALKKYQKRFADLKNELQEMIPQGMESEAHEFVGTKHVLEFSPCSTVRKVGDMVKLRNSIGEGTFMQIAKVLMEDVDKYLSAMEQESIIVRSQDGVRRCKIRELDPTN